MTIDKDRLRSLAERCLADQIRIGSDYHDELSLGVLSLFSEIDQLKADIQSLTQEADKQYATIENYRKDAERYQWLREPSASIVVRDIKSHMRGGYMDEQIDAAMAKEKSQ